MKATENFTLFNNYDFDFEWAKQDIAESQDIAIEDITDEMVWSHIGWLEQIDWEVAKRELKTISKNDYWIAKGGCGTWQGTFDAMQIFENSDEMLSAIVKDCDYVKIEYNRKGELFITASHHDGTNSFQCKLLTQKGYDAYDKWCYGDEKCSEYEKMNKLWNSNFHTKYAKLARQLGMCA